MPVTPFHFGPGLLVKAAAPRQVSLGAFLFANVLIDIESGYYLMQGEWPVHRTAHTLVGATVVGLLGGLVALLLSRMIDRPRTPPDTSPRSAFVVGGLLGGASHALLDAIMHSDSRPLLPFSDLNPLLGTITVGQLHLLCLLTGAAGALWLLVAKSRSSS